MATILDYFEQAQLSMAAYALGLQSGMSNADYRAALVAKGMSAKQAEVFATTYAVIDQFTDPSTGFSATVFDKGGVKYFAIRGTEGFTFAGAQDWLSNVLDVSAEGIAVRQGLALLNYLQRLYGAPNSEVAQYFYDPTNRTIGTTTGTANGLLSGQAPLSVTGHSLGGHLAMMMSRLAPDLVSSVYTYNAPGFDTTIRTNLFPLTSEGFFSALLNAPAPITGQIGISWNSGIMVHLNVEGGVVHDIGNTPGIQNIIFSESANQGAYDAHLKEPITDALALYDLFAKIDPLLNTTDPAIGIGRITGILKAASSEPALSLEAALDSLRKLFKDPAASNPALTATDNREQFYQNLLDTGFQQRIASYAGQLSISPLTDTAAADLANLAQGSTALAYRYALRELNPFAVVGNNDLYAPHNPNGELDVYDPLNRTGTLTTEWITDRAAFFAWKNQYFTTDGVTLRSDRDENYLFENRDGSGKADLSLTVVGNLAAGGNSGAAANPAKVIFGNTGTDVITGGILSDRLYGDAGTDWLEGKAGSDYLEGGLGLDIYNYNALSGLFGISGNDGADVIRDIDGKGVLRYTYTQTGFFSDTVSSTVIADASVQVSGLQWNSADGRFSYTRSQNDLIVTINGEAGGSITLKDFRDGDFGIRLLQTRATPETTNTLNAADYADGQTIYDTTGNDRILGDARGNFINASAGGSDWIQAGDGRDFVYALSTDPAEVKLIEGGAGDDVLTGGPGDDEVYANARVSFAQAITEGNGAGNGLHGDWLSGDFGDDVLVGDISNDGFAAGMGKDLIIAGAGDDNIFGDADWVATTLDWYYVDDPATNTRSFFWFNGTDNYDLGDADVIYAGSGDDYVWAGGGDDLVWGELGNDQLIGQSGSDVLIGGEGDDKLWGDGGGRSAAQPGDDYLDGGAGNDALHGEAGNDVLIGGPGNDTLIGGAGRDTYVFNKGDGTETVFDDDTSPNNPDASVLVLGEGIAQGDIKFKPGSLAVDIGPSDPADPNSPHDVIHFQGFDQLDPTATTPLGEIRFADGTSMSYADILAQGFDIDGTEGNDDGQPGDASQLVGTGVTDRIRGLGGNDVLFGLRGDDVLDGGTGADQLVGGAGADQMEGGEGDDFLWGDEDGLAAADQGADILSGGAGNDYLQGYGGDDRLFGGEGSDRLFGQAGADYIEGGDGDDFLWGDDSTVDQGNDTLDGGAGNDQLVGYAGNDTYVFGRGYGQDIVFDQDATAGNVDVVRFAADITPDEVTATQQAGTYNLALSINGTADVLTLANHFFSTADRVEEIRFADGTVWTPTTIPMLIRGTAGNDVLNGTAGPDVFESGAGSDVMSGGTGNDTYRYRRGDGADFIIDFDPTAGNRDKILFAADILPSEVRASRSGDDLRLTLNAIDLVAVNNYFQNDGVTPYSVEQVKFLSDGTVWDVNTVKQLVLAGTSGNDALTGYATDDALTGLGGNDTLIGNAGNDTLDGGTGNDNLQGSAGNDTYLIARGDGQDTITDVDATVGNVDRIQYAADILPSDVRATRSGDNLVLALTGTTDQVTVTNYFENDGATPSSVEQIEFLAEGTVWDVNAVKSLVIAPTAGADTLTGYATDDLLNGLGGDDVIRGAGGNDTLAGGAGNDTLSGEAGSDIYLFARGDGQDVIDNASSDSAGSTDVLAFASDILPGEVTPTRSGDDLVLTVSDSGGEVRVQNYFLSGPNVVEEIRFADGTVWTEQTIVSFLPINGTAGDDVLFGTDGNDAINGLGGNDVLNGGAGNDTLDGGTGNDTLQGGTGNDIYLIARGSGLDRIFDVDATVGNVDEIVYAADILPSEIQVVRSGFYLDLRLLGTTDRVIVTNYFENEGATASAIERIRFLADGTVWDYDMVRSILYTPTEGNDNIYGYETDEYLLGLGGNDRIFGQGGNDTLDGGAGNDVLEGDDGSDTYLFARGSGRDSIFNWALDEPGTTDVLSFAADISPSQITATKNPGDGTSLILTVTGTTDEVWIYGYFDGGVSTVEEIRFADGTVWTESTIANMFPVNGTSGHDNLVGTGLSEAINGFAGNDTLRGGRGNDTIDGGLGSDTLYGDDGNDLLIAGTGEAKNASVINNLYGGAGDDVLVSSGKTDNLYGDAGNDILLGGAKADWLEDSGGQNLMVGGAENDSFVQGGGGRDFVIGGPGSDSLNYFFGDTTTRIVYAFNKSDGWDQIGNIGSGSTLSIGGGTLYSNLKFESGSGGLTLATSSSNKVSFIFWYYDIAPNKPISTLQIIIEGTRDYAPTSADPMHNKKIQLFDFQGLVAAWEASGFSSRFNVAANLPKYWIGSSDTEAIGGAIAYQYARTGAISSLTYDEMRAVISAPQFAVSAQPITASSTLSVSSMSTESQDTATLSALTMVEGAASASATDSSAASEQVVSDAPTMPATNASDAVRTFEVNSLGLLSAPSPVVAGHALSTDTVTPPMAARPFMSATGKSGQPGNGQTSNPDLPDAPTPTGGIAAQHNDDAVQHSTSSTAPDASQASTDQPEFPWFDRLNQTPHFDFAALADYFEQEANRQHRVLTAEQIAGGWARVRRYTEALGIDSSVEDMGAFIPSGFEYGLGASGFESGAWAVPTRPVVGLTDATAANLKRFEGLQGAMQVLS